MCCGCEPRDCGCGGTAGGRHGHGPSFRRFYSAEEERARLESYREELKKEMEGVQERIDKLERK